MKTFEVDWIATIFCRNVGILILVAGGFHLHFYIKKSQGTRYKYSNKWPGKHRRFLFGDQTKDNVFRSIISGCTIWTVYEAITYWLFANGHIGFLSWEDHPIYFLLFYFAVHPIREAHFYFTHRLLHWKPLYRTAHYLHHKNTHTGPWSGLSMHPIEHLIYFTGVILHWIVLSHPLHALYHLQHLRLRSGTMVSRIFRLKKVTRYSVVVTIFTIFIIVILNVTMAERACHWISGSELFMMGRAMRIKRCGKNVAEFMVRIWLRLPVLIFL